MLEVPDLCNIAFNNQPSSNVPLSHLEKTRKLINSISNVAMKESKKCTIFVQSSPEANSNEVRKNIKL